MNRDLTPLEKSVLRRLLSVPTSQSAGLEAQVNNATVSGSCECGCPTIYISTTEPGPDEIYSVQGVYPPRKKNRPPVEVLLFTRKGKLSSLEYVFYDDVIPDEFPDPVDLQITVS
jgi:hypothetical protein